MLFLGGGLGLFFQKHAPKQHAGNQTGKMGCMVDARLHHGHYDGDDGDGQNGLSACFRHCFPENMDEGDVCANQPEQGAAGPGMVIGQREKEKGSQIGKKTAAQIEQGEFPLSHGMFQIRPEQQERKRIHQQMAELDMDENGRNKAPGLPLCNVQVHAGQRFEKLHVREKGQPHRRKQHTLDQQNG